MHKIYVMVDLDSLYIHQEKNNEFIWLENPFIFQLITELDRHCPKGISINLLLFSYKGDIIEEEEGIYYRKPNLGQVNFLYNKIIERCNNSLRDSKTTRPVIYNTISPYILADSLFDHATFSKLKVFLQNQELLQTDLLVISSNLILIDNVKQLGIKTIVTYHAGDIDQEAIQWIKQECQSNPTLNLHLFLDIDDTLLLRMLSCHNRRTVINKELASLIKEVSANANAVRASVLTSRSNPFRNISLLLELLRLNMKTYPTLKKACEPYMDIEDSYDSFQTCKVVKEIIKILNQLLDEAVSEEEINIISLIQKGFEFWSESFLCDSYLYVESVKKCLLAEYSITLGIESFSYVNINEESKASVIESVTSKYTSEESKNKIVIFFDDNKQELVDACKMKLRNENIQFLVVAIRADGELEFGFSKKLQSFTQSIVYNVPVSTSTQKHKLNGNDKDKQGFWKKPKIVVVVDESPANSNPNSVCHS